MEAAIVNDFFLFFIAANRPTSTRLFILKKKNIHAFDCILTVVS